MIGQYNYALLLTHRYLPAATPHHDNGLHSLAVDNDWAVLGLRVLVHHLKKSAWHEEYEEYEAHAAADLAHPPPELEQRVAEGVRVAGPLGVVELDHLPLLPVLPQPDSSDQGQGED